MSASGGKKAIIAALLANLGIAATKFVAWLLTMSSSMLAEAIHSVADSGNQLLLIIGGKRAAKGANAKHPFGYGRERYLYAFIVSIVLFTLGGLFALYEAYHKIADPHPIESWQWVPVVILVAAIGMEGFSFRTAIAESNEIRGTLPWKDFIRRAKAPELPVILLEDFAALIGLCFALFGVGMTLLTGDGIWDGIGTAFIGILLVCVAAVLAVEMRSLLIGEAAAPENIRAIEEAILAGPEVERIIHMRTVHIGPEELLVAAKIAVHHDDTAREVARGIDAAESRIRAAVPIARVIYLEPDIYRAAEGGDGGVPHSEPVLPDPELSRTAVNGPGGHGTADGVAEPSTVNGPATAG